MAGVWEVRYVDALKRLLSLRESTDLTVLQDLMPVLPMCDPAGVVEACYRGERPAWGSAIANAGGAGVTSFVRLSALVASELVVVLDVTLWTIAAAVVRLSIGGTTAHNGSRGWRDNRFPSSPGIPNAAVASGGNAAGPLFSGHGRAVLPANVPVVLPVNVVLSPGSSLQAELETGNQMLGASFRWTERTVGSDELKQL